MGGTPDLVALQELPLWAMPRIAGWSGMRAVGATTKPALLGTLAGPLHRRRPRYVRSPLTGQANAVLLGPRLTLMASRRVVLNPGTWRERRVALVLSLSVNAEKLVAVDVHASVGQRQARSELDRVADLVGEPGACVVCGDFNVPGLGLPGFSAPLPGIDQVLVRGLELIRGPDVWPEEDRRIGDEVVSDHAPVEAVVTLPGSGG